MDQVFAECHRLLKSKKYVALYVSDSYVHGKGFFPIGFELFARLQKRFEPVDVVAVTRHNKTLDMGNYRKAAEEGNFFLRGFNYLFVFAKSLTTCVSASRRILTSVGPERTTAGSGQNADHAEHPALQMFRDGGKRKLARFDWLTEQIKIVSRAGEALWGWGMAGGRSSRSSFLFLIHLRRRKLAGSGVMVWSICITPRGPGRDNVGKPLGSDRSGHWLLGMSPACNRSRHSL